jgi:hypothetical protein
MMCPDAVEWCPECSLPPVDEDGNRRWHYMTIFSLGDTFCEHLTAKLGTDSASHYSHFKYDHDGDDCPCVAGNWFGDRPRPIIEEDE